MTMKLALSLAVAALLAAVLASSARPAGPVSAGAGRTSVDSWMQLELELIATHRVNPPRAARALALLAVG